MLHSYTHSSVMEEMVAIIRDKQTQSSEFRRAMKKIGSCIAYEIGKVLPTESYTVETALAPATAIRVSHPIAIISILRAALPMSDGVLDSFDSASTGFVAASRGKMTKDDASEFEINMGYMKLPNLEGHIVIIVDPMLATASTLLKMLGHVAEQQPQMIIIACAIASKLGIEKLEAAYPNATIIPAAIDEHLNNLGYIVPGLGDAGDRAFRTEH